MGHEPLSTYLLMYGILALLLGAGYIYDKYAPPTETTNPFDEIDTGIHIGYETFDSRKNILDVLVFNKDALKLISLDALVYKVYCFFDKSENYSFYTSLLNLDVFIGADWGASDSSKKNSMKVGLFAMANLADLGYEGRYLGVSFSVFGVGAGLGWQDGKLMGKLDLPVVPVGLGISINFGQILYDIGGLFR